MSGSAYLGVAVTAETSCSLRLCTKKEPTDDGRRYVDLLLTLLQAEKTASDRRSRRRTCLFVTHDEKENIQTQARTFSR
jgi:hypothetical protein